MPVNEIHKTHSRTDLIEIIEIFNLDINDYELLSKESIRHNIMIALKSVCEVAPNSEFPITDLDTLCDFLSHPSPRKSLSPDDKLEIMKKVKKIIHFVQLCSCDIPSSHYDSLQSVKKDIHYIKSYGDFPSVRRAIRLFNEARLCDVIYPALSLRIKRRLELQKTIKDIGPPGLHCESKKVHLSFD
jgi:hypothetical protein